MAAYIEMHNFFYVSCHLTYTSVYIPEGEQGQQCHQELQQAGSPWFLHHLERKILAGLERRGLP